MPQYAYRIQPARIGMLADGPTSDEAEVVGRHFEYLRELTAQGRVLLAGRTLATDDSAFGIVVFEADSEAEAREMVAADPAVRHGVMRAQLWPFRVALWSEHGPRPGDESA
jgi:uncharacterized protein YciI